MNFETLRKANAGLAIATIVLFIITGYGITEYQFVEAISFGLLTKALSFQIHYYLIIPLAIFLTLHIWPCLFGGGNKK